MGTLKLEIDIPNFEKELSINIIIRKDGEVVYNTTSSPSTGLVDNTKKEENNLLEFGDKHKTDLDPSKELDQKTTTKATRKKKSFGGNMMDLEI